MRAGWITMLLLIALTWEMAALAGEPVLFREDFETLDAWEPYYFPNISRHTEYRIQALETSTVLMAVSSNSASALVSKQSYNIVDYPTMRWSWKVDNLYAKGNYQRKSGDDYPMRIYVFFAYDPETAPAGMKIKYEMARAVFGRYPPLRCLTYIWANHEQETEMTFSPYAENSIMIPLQHGAQNIGRWVDETVNVLDDYRKAFNEDPPAEAFLGIMNDSDNTGGQSVSYIRYIEVGR